MPLAPVEFAMFAFDDTRITGDIVPALTALVENELVHIIDLVFVRKEADGQATAFEIDDLPADAAAAFADLDHDIEGLVSTEDLDHEADLLEPGTSAIIVVWENLWAQRSTDAVRAAGGVLVDNQRIPAEVVEAALADELADRNLT